MRRLWVLGLVLTLASCSGKYGAHPPYPTTGRVKVNGQPAKGAMVVFHHVGDWGEKSIVPRAWTDDAGRFTLSTYGVGDGAPAGEYRVAVQWPAYRRGKNVGPDLLGGKFAKSATSGLTARVAEGTNELPAFEIKAELVEVEAPKERPRRGSRRSRDR
jgi:hypothetical protein